MINRRKTLKELSERVRMDVEMTNQQIEKLGGEVPRLYESIEMLQDIIDCIRNIPTEQQLQFDELKQIRISWKEKLDKIERDFDISQIKNAGAGATGATAGVAVASLGPTAAMGIAYTFGVASTGTAISSLSGAAATNAALAWLGGGAIAANGGGMAAGSAFLAMFGPIGWSIAGVSILASGFFFIKGLKDQHRLEDIFIEITENNINQYNIAFIEIKERIKRIKDETKKLRLATDKIITFGTDFKKMTIEQQYELGSYVNLLRSSIQLLITPIMGLQPKYTEEDFKKFKRYGAKGEIKQTCNDYPEIIYSLVSFLGSMELYESDKKLLLKTFKHNKEMLNSFEITKKELTMEIIDAVFAARKYKGYPVLTKKEK